MVQIHAIIPVYLMPQERRSKIQGNGQNRDMDPNTKTRALLLPTATQDSLYFFCRSLAHSLSQASILLFISESSA